MTPSINISFHPNEDGLPEFVVVRDGEVGGTSEGMDIIKQVAEWIGFCAENRERILEGRKL